MLELLFHRYFPSSRLDLHYQRRLHVHQRAAKHTTPHGGISINSFSTTEPILRQDPLHRSTSVITLICLMNVAHKVKHLSSSTQAIREHWPAVQTKFFGCQCAATSPATAVPPGAALIYHYLGQRPRAV